MDGISVSAGLTLYEDVLDAPLAALVLRTGRQWFADGAFDRSSADWEPGIVRASTPVLIRDFGGPIAATLIAALARRGVVDGPHHRLMLFAWPQGSYIAWHNDGMHASAATIYLNDIWRRDWGGLFLYEAGEDIRAVVPRFNLGLRNAAHVPHATTPVMPDAPEPRFTLQLFGTTEVDRAAV